MTNPTLATMSPPVRRLSLWIAAMVLALTSRLPAAEPNPADLRPNAVTFRQMRYGIFIHNVYGLTGWPDGRKSATLDQFANAFNARGFADEMASIGVEYVFFTAWHKSMYLLGPNKALEKWLPGHTAKRDLVGEIADALQAKGIKLVIYAHPNDGHDLTAAEQARIGYANRGADKNRVLNQFINEVYSELSERYGRKPNVLGYWWDNWWANGGCIDVPRLRKTVLAKFPGAIILSNMYDANFIDFFSIEGGGPPPVDRMSPQKDNLTFYVMGDWWNAGGGRISFTPEEMYRFQLLNVGTGAPGGMCWAASPLADGTTWSRDQQPLRVLQTLGKLIAPVRPTMCGVLPSRNWRLAPNTLWADAPAFVAGRSPANDKEYIHVMKAPEGGFIDLPAPTETFASARLYLNKHPVTIARQDDGLRLTLPTGDKWDALDTVIELTIKP